MLNRLGYRLRNHQADVLALFFLAAIAVKYFYNAPQFLDIDLFDETTYLYSGVRLPQLGMRDASYGPLYALWFFLLSLATPDRIVLFYLNFYLLTTGVAVSLYLVLRSNQVPIWLSSIFAVLLLVSTVNVDTFPRVSHFALIILLVSLALASRVRSVGVALAMATVGGLLASFSRAEHGINFALGAALLVGLALWQRQQLDRPSRVAIAGTVLILAVGILVMGNPLAVGEAGSERSFSAFLQHFAANQVFHNPNGMDPWTSVAFIKPLFFPTAQSVPQAFAENPSAFMQHVRWNASALTTEFIPKIFTSHYLWVPSMDRLSLALLLVAMALLFFFRRRVVLENIKRRWVVLFFLTLSFGLMMGTSLITMPREIYLLRPVAFLLAILGILLTGGTATTLPCRKAVLVTGVFALALIPPMVLGGARTTPNLTIIQYLRELNINKPAHVLTAEGSYGWYVDDRYTNFPVEDIAARSADEYLAQNGINMIVLTPRLAQDVRYTSSPMWQQLVQDPAALGFVEYAIPGTDARLLVHETLLQP